MHSSPVSSLSYPLMKHIHHCSDIIYEVERFSTAETLNGAGCVVSIATTG